MIIVTSSTGSTYIRYPTGTVVPDGLNPDVPHEPHRWEIIFWTTFTSRAIIYQGQAGKDDGHAVAAGVAGRLMQLTPRGLRTKLVTARSGCLPGNVFGTFTALLQALDGTYPAWGRRRLPSGDPAVGLGDETLFLCLMPL